MSRIITSFLLAKAVSYAVVMATEIIDEADFGWGPNWAEGLILFEDTEYGFNLGGRAERLDWDPEWGPELDFREIVELKARATHRTGLSSRDLVHCCPHLYIEGEYRYVGTVHWEGITVAISGLKSEADEAIALIVLSVIKMLIFLECRERDERGEDQV